MKKRIQMILLLTTAACTMLAGCKKNVGTPEDNAVVETEEGEEEEESGYLFGYSGMDMDNPYFETLELSIQTALEEEGHRILTKDPGADPELQNEQIQELIDAQVDAVFLSPVDQEKVTPALEALEEAGIPVINVDTKVKDTERIDALSDRIIAMPDMFAEKI